MRHCERAQPYCCVFFPFSLLLFFFFWWAKQSRIYLLCFVYYGEKALWNGIHIVYIADAAAAAATTAIATISSIKKNDKHSYSIFRCFFFFYFCFSNFPQFGKNEFMEKLNFLPCQMLFFFMAVASKPTQSPRLKYKYVGISW